MPPIEHWLSTWKNLSLPESAPLKDLYRELISQYQSPTRYYHNEQHLDECFAHFKNVQAEAEHPAEVELAIWFHDAIYDAKRRDNEEKSADWARREALRFGVAGDAAGRVHALILSTRHQSLPDTQDAKILVDVDLAILGAEPGRFDEYEGQVREEYAWVPGFLFRRKRRQLLEELLARQAIYSTTLFQESLEQRARVNLRRSLERL